MFHTFNGTGGATESEVFFDGQASGVPHQPAKRLRIRNTDAADALEVSLDQRRGWIEIAAGAERIWEASGHVVISNSRLSFWHRRKGAGDATFEGDCVTDPGQVR